jgi:peptidoglycan-associated lipoprotein
MRKRMLGFFIFLCCGALTVGGCAKKELVKGEGEIPSATSTKPAEPGTAAQEPGKATVKNDKVQEQTINEAPAAVKGEPVPAEQQAQMEKIYFDFDSFILSAPSRSTLAKNAEYLQKSKSLKVRIEGNCDERGSDDYNLALGEKRAKAAMNYLVTMGVSADRISIISYGKEKPADPGHDEAAWAKNRRDEFILSK